MDICNETSPEWFVDFHKQTLRGKHVLLYGNTEDLTLRPGGHETLLIDELLADYFREEGFQLIARYDIVDGFSLADPDTMRPLWHRASAVSPAALPTSPGADPPSAHSAETAEVRPGSDASQLETVSQSSGGDEAHVAAMGPNEPNQIAADEHPPSAKSSLLRRPSGRSLPGSGRPAEVRPQVTTDPVSTSPANGRAAENRLGRGEPARTDPALLQPANAIPVIRRAIRQSDISMVVIFHYGDKLISDPERQSSQDERRHLVALRKMLSEAAELVHGTTAGRRNTIIFVGNGLSGIPPWFYQDHPLLSLIQIPPPGVEERRRYIQQFASFFDGGRELNDKSRPVFIEQFVDQTEGLTNWDLEAIGRTSVVEQLPVAGSNAVSTSKLVNYYKYGQRDDPWEQFDEKRVREAPTALSSRVIGQPQAVAAVVDMLVTARIGITMSPAGTFSGKPKGAFFFVGPTGVGKTELAKALTKHIFGDESRMARFDMSEYQEKHAAEKFAGAPPGYVGYDAGGQLTNYVRQHPFSLLLFDEIEKANGLVLDKFLQILEDGRLTDSKGQTVYFSQTVIIFTSNIGATTLESGLKLTEQNASGDQPSYDEVQRHFVDSVRHYFINEKGRPEILNRLGESNILAFDLLRPRYVDGIARKFLTTLTKTALQKHQLRLSIDDSLIDLVRREMCRPENFKFGGRRIRTLLEERLERPLNRWVFLNSPAAESNLDVSVDPNQNSVCVNGENIEVVASCEHPE